MSCTILAWTTAIGSWAVAATIVWAITAANSRRDR